MNKVCPVCGIAFEREPGFFLGAIYFSYVLGVAVGSPFYLYLTLGLGWSMTRGLVATGVLFALLSPVTFRYSRVLWLHLDQRVDPR